MRSTRRRVAAVTPVVSVAPPRQRLPARAADRGVTVQLPVPGPVHARKRRRRHRRPRPSTQPRVMYRRSGRIERSIRVRCPSSPRNFTAWVRTSIKGQLTKLRRSSSRLYHAGASQLDHTTFNLTLSLTFSRATTAQHVSPPLHPPLHWLVGVQHSLDAGVWAVLAALSPSAALLRA